MMSSAYIRLQSMSVGEVRVDSARMRGEGGAHDPRLIVPIEIQMNQRPEEQRLALTRLTGSLHLSEPAFPQSQLGPSCSLDLIENMSCHTISSGPSKTSFEFRFSLTQAQIKHLEDARHASHQSRFALFLKLEGITAWLRHTWGSDNSRIGEEERWLQQVGFCSELLPFWNTRIDPLRVEVEPSSWVENVLPGLGYDRVRLVEIDLSQMPDEGISVAQFDKARREFDAGRYTECVATCRAIRHAWEQALSATREQPVARVLAERLGRSASDWPYKVLDKMWAGYADMVNAPHHPGQTPEPLSVTAADAKFCLLVTLALSEYVDRLRSAHAGV